MAQCALVGGPDRAAKEDLGAIVARAFDAPRSIVGKDLTLASDARSLHECRSIYREVMGRDPRRFPMPVWMFGRLGFAGRYLITMWRWLRTGAVDLDTVPTRAPTRRADSTELTDKAENSETVSC